MRLVLLLIILAQTWWIGDTLGSVANHYDYLQKLYLGSMDKCDNALEYCRVNDCRKQ